MKKNNYFVIIVLSAVLAQSVYPKQDECFKTTEEASVDFFQAILQQAQEQLKNNGDLFSEIIEKISSDISQQQDLLGISIEDFQNPEKATYGVKVTLPKFTKEEISVTVKNDTDQSIAVKKILVITAGHQEQTSENEKEITNDTAQEDKPAPLADSYASHYMETTLMVQGKKQEIIHADGVVTITMDLPHTIDEDNYTMTFKDDLLVLEFSTNRDHDKAHRSLIFTAE